MALGPNELHWKPEDCDGVGVHDYQRVEVLEKVIDKELLTAVMSDEGVITLTFWEFQHGVYGWGSLPKVAAELVRRYQASGWRGMSYEVTRDNNLILRFREKEGK